MIFFKSKEIHNHVNDLKKVFKRPRQYKLRIKTCKVALAYLLENS